MFIDHARHDFGMDEKFSGPLYAEYKAHYDALLAAQREEATLASFATLPPSSADGPGRPPLDDRSSQAGSHASSRGGGLPSSPRSCSGASSSSISSDLAPVGRGSGIPVVDKATIPGGSASLRHRIPYIPGDKG